MNPKKLSIHGIHGLCGIGVLQCQQKLSGGKKSSIYDSSKKSQRSGGDSEKFQMLTILMATSSPVLLDLALYTQAKPPLPKRLSTR